MSLFQRYVTVEPALFLFMFAAFMSYPLMYELVMKRVCDEHNCTISSDLPKNSSSHGCPHVPSAIKSRVIHETSLWILYINIANSLPSIMAALATGAWSDRVGRKVVMSFPAVGLSVNAFFVLLVWYLHLPLEVLFAGQILSGFMGGYGTFNLGMFAYMSDITSTAYRTTRIGILESMIFLGGMLGNIIGGLWVRSGNFAPAFWCIFACGIAVLLYVNVIVRESRPKRRWSYQQHKCKAFFRCNNLVKAFSLFVRFQYPYWPLVLAISVFVLVSINFAGIIDVVTLYVFDWPLCWSSKQLGYFLASKMGMNGVAILLFLPLLKKVGLSDLAVINIGLVSGVASLILMGLASHAWMMYLVPVVGALRGSVVPSLRSLMSKMVNENDHGALFAAVACFEVSCSLLATIIFNNMYPATNHLLTPHGVCFFFMSGMLVIAMIVTIVLRQGWYSSGDDSLPERFNVNADYDTLGDQDGNVRSEDE